MNSTDDCEPKQPATDQRDAFGISSSLRSALSAAKPSAVKRNNMPKGRPANPAIVKFKQRDFKRHVFDKAMSRERKPQAPNFP